jgi:hypothetical protein
MSGANDDRRVDARGIESRDRVAHPGEAQQDAGEQCEDFHPHDESRAQTVARPTPAWPLRSHRPVESFRESMLTGELTVSHNQLLSR